MVAGVAYLDPGNVASNITGGSQFGYLLIWVVVLGNLIAWVVQYLSAQLGIVTGLSLPEVMGKRIQSRTGRFAYWVQGELVAMATDVKGSATGAGSKPAPNGMLHSFDAPTTGRLAGGSLLSVTYFANPVQYTFRGPAVFTIDATGPKVSEGATPEVKRVGPEKSIDGGLTKDQWRRLQQATVVMRSSRLAFAVISPNQTTLLAPRVEFSWTQAAGAQGYRVSLHDDADMSLATWTSATTTSEVPASTRLEPGKSYRWKVETLGTPTPLAACQRMCEP
jgi:hypothetical protein